MAEYPSDEELEGIDYFEGTVAELVDYLQDLWEYDEPILKVGRSSFDRKKVYKLYAHTWGWSGNEDIIGQLQSTMFWMTCWRKSERGGHYEFEIQPWMMEKKMFWGNPIKKPTPPIKGKEPTHE